MWEAELSGRGVPACAALAALLQAGRLMGVQADLGAAFCCSLLSILGYRRQLGVAVRASGC